MVWARIVPKFKCWLLIANFYHFIPHLRPRTFWCHWRWWQVRIQGFSRNKWRLVQLMRNFRHFTHLHLAIIFLLSNFLFHYRWWKNKNISFSSNSSAGNDIFTFRFSLLLWLSSMDEFGWMLPSRSIAKFVHGCSKWVEKLSVGLFEFILIIQVCHKIGK